MKEDIYSQQAFEYVRKNHSPSEVSDFQAAMNIAVMKAFIAGAQWADKSVIDKACEWLKDNVNDYLDWYDWERCRVNKDELLYDLRKEMEE